MRQWTRPWAVWVVGGLLIGSWEPAAAETRSQTVGVLIIVPERNAPRHDEARDPLLERFDPPAVPSSSPSAQYTKSVLRHDRRVTVVHTSTPAL